MEQRRCSFCMKLKTGKICEHCGYDENTPGALHHLPAGVVLQGQYMIGRVLGQGGFGITYLGWDQNLDTPIAVKEYFPMGYVQRNHKRSLEIVPNRDTEAEFCNGRDHFLREAKILARLSDVPEVVHIRNFFQANGTAYIVMEYIGGITLSKYIRKRVEPLSLTQALTILKPIMVAMAEVHDAELIHRDISPENIMLYHNRVKLLDFGAARDVGDADASKALPKSTQAMVKHGYAPIEQYQRRGALGPWTDVYGICATLYFCLTGKAPSSAPDRLSSGDQLDWKRMAPELTTQQLDILDRAMALRPKERIRDMRTLLEGLCSGRMIITQDIGDAAGIRETQKKTSNEGAYIKNSPKAAAKNTKTTRDVRISANNNPPFAIPNAGRKTENYPATAPIEQNHNRYPQTVPVSQSAGQYPQTMPVSRGAGQYPQTVPVSRGNNPYPQTVPISRGNNPYPQTVPISQGAGQYPQTVPVSRGAGQYPQTVPISRGNDQYPKTVPARNGTYDFPATAFDGSKSNDPGTEPAKEEPQNLAACSDFQQPEQQSKSRKIIKKIYTLLFEP